MTIVVTGASGFLGGAVVEALGRRGQKVVAVSRRPLSVTPPLRAMQVRDYAELKPTDSDSALVHLAEPRDISAAQSGATAHLAAMRATLAALLAQPWAHVLYISSAAVYGDAAGRARRPETPASPAGVYAAAKAMCEQDVLARGGGVVRLTNVYGPGMAQNNVIGDILAQIPGDGPLKVRDTGPVRDYLWIEDAARGIADAAIGRTPGVINLGTGRGISVGDLARLALTLAGERERPVVATAPAGGRSELVLDVEPTAAALGWQPAIALEQGLSALLSRPR